MAIKILKCDLFQLLSIGSTYSINSDTAVSVNASFGGSSASPDSIFGISLWRKF